MRRAPKRPEDLLHEAAERGRVAFAIRRRRLQKGLRSVLQTAVSAALAWYLAKLVWGHPAPLFAAIAAITVSSTSLGRQRRLATELALGVAVGIFIAELLVRGIGTGGCRSRPSRPGHAGRRRTRTRHRGRRVRDPAGHRQVPESGISPDRFLDALMGGAVSLPVNAILFPVDPILTVGRAAQPVFLDRHLTGRAVSSLAAARRPAGSGSVLRDDGDVRRRVDGHAPRGAMPGHERRAGDDQAEGDEAGADPEQARPDPFVEDEAAADDEASSRRRR